MSGTLAKLQRMADQIALNFTAIGKDNAVLATADHIAKFWDPRMKAAIFASDLSILSPIARSAVENLRAGHEPPPQTGATEFNAVDEVGHSDAG
ncbi:MAG: formate dehydrogenase subunit delta [Sphingomonadales bacterium]|nr:formate dehydrogenase subunit delta [Sphingomonadales bacterium]MBD3773031.1 formate dehydrogenase subunit delta [Paracoccaceae bacterium]MBD3813603.1 formate dehydrogenase subunit delta [Betaproteobacteria bacterium]